MASFTGTWQVIYCPDFDEGYLRMEVDPYVILKQSGERVEGKYQVGLQTGSLDGWLESENFMLFSFEGWMSSKRCTVPGGPRSVGISSLSS
jgi:hypothetical protein